MKLKHLFAAAILITVAWVIASAVSWEDGGSSAASISLAPLTIDSGSTTGVIDGNIVIRSTAAANGHENPIIFKAKNSNGDYVTYAAIVERAADSTANGEDGLLKFYVIRNNALVPIAYLTGLDSAFVVSTGSVVGFGTPGVSIGWRSGGIQIMPGPGALLFLGDGTSDSGTSLYWDGFTSDFSMSYNGLTNTMSTTGLIVDNSTHTFNSQIAADRARLADYTKAALTVLTPASAGIMYYCSDCSTDGVVVSTGTGKGAFGRISARTTIIN